MAGWKVKPKAAGRVWLRRDEGEAEISPCVCVCGVTPPVGVPGALTRSGDGLPLRRWEVGRVLGGRRDRIRPAAAILKSGCAGTLNPEERPPILKNPGRKLTSRLTQDQRTA